MHRKFTSMKKILIFGAFCSAFFASAQQKQVQRATVAFMNVENLWDIYPSADYIDGTKDKNNPAFHRSVPIDSLKYLEVTEEYKGEWSDDNLIGKKVIRHQILNTDFTADSPKRWNEASYKDKMGKLAKLISELGRQYTNTSPAIVGLIEVENRQVIEDLIKEPVLAKEDYGIIHYNSYDARGVDVALIYQKKRFIPTNSLKAEIKNYNDDGKRSYTRDVVVVSGLLDGEKVGIFMNHWPSRSGGEAASAAKRNAAAAVLKKQMDSMRAENPDVKLFAMGDFNDDPVNASLTKHLGAVGDPKKLSDQTPYFNPMWKLFKNGVASLAYRDAPNLFDQIIVSKNLVTEEKLTPTYTLYRAEIYAPKYLITDSGQWKGYPLRSWNGDTYTGGYSDHFPAVSIVQREYVKK